MKISDFSDANLCKALQCCAGDTCKNCPCNEPAIENCMDEINLEAARRLDKLTAIRAERDAYEKELRKLGIKI